MIYNGRMWNRLGRLKNLTMAALLVGGLGLTGATSQANAATLHTAQIIGFSYAPDPLNVAVGDSVQWLNVSPNTDHDVALFPTPGKPFEFQLPVIGPGQTTPAVLMTTAGTYVLQCTLHGTSMRQTLIVSAVPPVEVDEVPLPVLLTVSAAGCLGIGALMTRRRRQLA